MGILIEFMHLGILNRIPYFFLELFGLGEFHVNNENLAILLFPIDG